MGALGDLLSMKNKKQISQLDIQSANRLFDTNRKAGKYPNKGKVIESFSSLTGFTTTSCDIALDAVNTRVGGAGIQMTLTTNSTAGKIAKTVSWDLSTMQNLMLPFYCADPAYISMIEIYLYHNSAYMYARQNKYVENLHEFIAGRNAIKFAAAEFVLASGSMSLADSITQYKIVVTPTTGHVTVVTVDALIRDVIGESYFSFTFDDAYDNLYTEGFPYLASKGFKASACINPSHIGEAGRCTLAQTKEIYNAGWDVLNHGYAHADLSAATYEAAETEIVDAREYLRTNGITRNLDMFVYPNAYTAIAKQILEDKNFVLGRAADHDYCYTPVDDMMRLKVLSMTGGTLATVQPYIDKAIASKMSIIFLIHKLVVTGGGLLEFQISDFHAIVDYLDSINANVIPLSEFYNDITAWSYTA